MYLSTYIGVSCARDTPIGTDNYMNYILLAAANCYMAFGQVVALKPGHAASGLPSPVATGGTTEDLT